MLPSAQNAVLPAAPVLRFVQGEPLLSGMAAMLTSARSSASAAAGVHGNVLPAVSKSGSVVYDEKQALV